MVSKLKFFERDPMYPRRNRGRGFYYNRGHLSTGLVRAGQRNPPGMRGDYWSKYDEKIDGKKRFAPTKVRNISKSEESQPHKADYKTRVKREGSHKVVYFKTKRVATTRDKGFF